MSIRYDRLEEQKSLELPFGFGVLPHAIPNGVDLLPTFSPLMGITFLRSHVDNLQIVAPPLRIFLLVPLTVSLDSPFPWALPLHYTSALIGGKYDDEFASTTKK